MKITPTLAIACYHSTLSKQAKQLAEHLHIPFASQKRKTDFILKLTSEHLEIQDCRKNAPGPIFVDFTSSKLDFRMKFGGGGKQTIARAIGISNQKNSQIIDATAGLGEDSFILASLGCSVIMLERSPIIAALLSDGLMRAELNINTQPIINRMQLIETDACHYLEKLEPDSFPDVIYIDPMYPYRKKSALVKKEMRITREIVGDDIDSADILTIAQQRCKNRIVVKRPSDAPLLDNQEPSLQMKSKSTRYDIYLVQ